MDNQVRLHGRFVLWVVLETVLKRLGKTVVLRS